MCPRPRLVELEALLGRGYAGIHGVAKRAYSNETADQPFNRASTFSTAAMALAWSLLVKSTSSRKPSRSSRVIRPPFSKSSWMPTTRYVRTGLAKPLTETASCPSVRIVSLMRLAVS